jgi:preprotein translocase subunit SecE
MNVVEYVSDVNKEMRKVSWPSRNELISNTLITLLATAVVSLYIYAADQVISRILEFIYQ